MRAIRRAFLFAMALAAGTAGAQTQSVTEQWAATMSRATYEDLSAEVIERVKLSLLDRHMTIWFMMMNR